MLLPWNDKGSRDVLIREGFDSACMEFDTAIPYDEAFAGRFGGRFGYLGERMRIIAEVVKEGKPEPAMFLWLENKFFVELVKLVIATFTAIVTVAALVVGLPILWKQRNKGM
jgi:hypothetical protein